MRPVDVVDRLATFPLFADVPRDELEWLVARGDVREYAADTILLDVGAAIDDTRPRVVMQFSSDPNNLLLSGTLANGQFLTNRAAALDHPVGKGHVVMFAIRPFWRWQTQGTYTLGFNAIMNWNDLDAGKQQAAPRGTASQQPQ